jgi:AcrR family transcriptional regulator
MHTSDPRVQRTQEALAKAMIALTLEKGYEAVTIRDLSERAGIGYATFFRHYPDKAALLNDVLEVFVAELLRALQQHAGEGAGGPAASGTLIFRYIEEHQALSRVLLASQGLGALVRRLEAISGLYPPAGRQPRAGGIVPPEVAANHLVVASIGLIQWWLENDRPYPPERMGEVYAALIIEPTQRLAFG